MERPEEPARHNVAGNGKRDGAKAEKSQEGLEPGRMAVGAIKAWTIPSVCSRPCTAMNKGLFSYECP